MATLTIGYCTRKTDPVYVQMLRDTCGVEDADIVPVENDGSLSMTEAYLKIFHEHPASYMVFIHDDLTFKTDKWGKIMIDLLDKNDFGVVGLAGSTYLDDSGKGWWSYTGCVYGQVWHRGANGVPYLSAYSGKLPEGTLKEVVCLDGIFIGIRPGKTRAPWNKDIPGFHYYDMDFTIHNHINGTKVGVTTDISVLHESRGETNDQWGHNQRVFYDIYREYFPVFLGKNTTSVNHGDRE